MTDERTDRQTDRQTEIRIDGQTDRRTGTYRDESSYIGRCPTNVECPI